jgi:ribose 5-phosphate isomerase B
VSIAANRHRSVRAALCSEPLSATLSRAHNDANVLCLGARLTGPGMADAIVRAFDAGAYEGGRHQRRVDKIELG